jgi:hypothetical protein
MRVCLYTFTVHRYSYNIQMYEYLYVSTYLLDTLNVHICNCKCNIIICLRVITHKMRNMDVPMSPNPPYADHMRGLVTNTVRFFFPLGISVPSMSLFVHNIIAPPFSPSPVPLLDVLDDPLLSPYFPTLYLRHYFIIPFPTIPLSFPRFPMLFFLY